MKAPMMILALFGFSAVVMAQERNAKTEGQQIPVEHYTYATQVDVAKVISEDQIPDVCGVVPIYMTYLDSKGNQHLLEYEVMGGCSNG